MSAVTLTSIPASAQKVGEGGVNFFSQSEDHGGFVWLLSFTCHQLVISVGLTLAPNNKAYNKTSKLK